MSFLIDPAVRYLNCAYMSPLPQSVCDAGQAGVMRKARPWTIGAEDFYTEVADVKAVDGISFTGDVPTLLVVALVFGVLNVVVRPILKLLTCPFIILTLGLFTFVLNAVMLLITSAASEALGLGFQVAGFVPAFIGAIVVSIVSFALSLLVGSNDKKKDQ